MLVSPSGCNQYVQQFYEKRLREFNVKVEADPQAANLKEWVLPFSMPLQH